MDNRELERLKWAMEEIRKAMGESMFGELVICLEDGRITRMKKNISLKPKS